MTSRRVSPLRRGGSSSQVGRFWASFSASAVVFTGAACLTVDASFLDVCSVGFAWTTLLSVLAVVRAALSDFFVLVLDLVLGAAVDFGDASSWGSVFGGGDGSGSSSAMSLLSD